MVCFSYSCLNKSYPTDVQNKGGVKATFWKWPKVSSFCFWKATLIRGGLIQHFSTYLWFSGVFYMLLGVSNESLPVTLKKIILPWLPGVWKIAKPNYNPKNNNHWMGVLDISNEASGCADYNAKSLNSLKCVVGEKIKENRK